MFRGVGIVLTVRLYLYLLHTCFFFSEHGPIKYKYVLNISI